MDNVSTAFASGRAIDYLLYVAPIYAVVDLLNGQEYIKMGFKSLVLIASPSD